MAAQVITVAIEKGGAGKTVTAQNIAYLMGDEGKRVLCVDTDPQGNLTTSLSGGELITSPMFRGKGLYNLINGYMYGSKTEDYIQETNYENVDMIPANASTPRINTCIPQILEDVSEGLEDGDPRKNISAESFLDYFLKQVKENYDYIVIDTQPTRDALLLTNALAAADYVLIPMMPDAYSETSAFRTWAMCNGLKESGKYHIKGARVFFTNYDKNAASSRLVMSQCKKELGSSLFDIVVPASRSVGMSINKNVPVCYMAKTQPAAKAFVEIYHELKNRLADLEVK